MAEQKYTFTEIVDNIEQTFLEAREADIGGANWYHEAQQDVQALADRFNIDLDVCAAIVAALSPRIRWRSKTSTPNLDAAENLIRGFLHHRKKTDVFKKVAGFDRNKFKAWDILRTGDTSLLSGPKVWAFFQNLLNPNNDNFLTIDSWMTCIGCGLPYDQAKNSISPTPLQAEYIQTALRVVAYGYGLDSAVELQAILWTYAKAKAGGRFAH